MKAVIVVVQDLEKRQLYFYMKKHPLIEEEKLFLHSDKLLISEKETNCCYIFHTLLRDFHPMDLELYLEDIKKFNETITLKELLTINREDWCLIEEKDINSMSKKGVSFDTYFIRY